MKIALIADTHFGARGDVSAIREHQEWFFEKIFFPEIEKQGVSCIIHAGDFFDSRKSISLQTMALAKRCFLDPLENTDIDCYIIPGNHDVYYKDTNDVNSLSAILKHHPNVELVEEFKTIEPGLNGHKFMLAPWVNENNKSEFYAEMKRTDAPVMVGHFDIKGFRFSKFAKKSEHGFDASNFSKFDKVYTGHYHGPQCIKNIEYLGAPYQMNRGDRDDVRGFHIIDTEKSLTETQYIENQEPLFVDLSWPLDKAVKKDFPKIAGRYVRLFVADNSEPKNLKKLTNAIQDRGAFDLQIIDQTAFTGEIDAIDSDEIAESVSLKNTTEIMGDYIDAVDNVTEQERKAMKTVMNKIYEECDNERNSVG